MKKKDKILREISRVARQILGNNNGRIYLYGSQARGDVNPHSDWDLIIVTNDNLSVANDIDTFRKYAFPFAEIGWHFGAQITPIHFTHSQWEAQRGTPFFINVTSEAIQL